MTVDRPIVVTPDTSDDVPAQQGKPSIALHCDRGIVGYWKLGGGSEALNVWQFIAFICK